MAAVVVIIRTTTLVVVVGFSFGGVKAERCPTSESEEYVSSAEEEELETGVEKLSVR